MSGVYSSPIAALAARMAYHCTATEGRLLNGYRWYDVPVEHQDGPSDLPAVQLFLPDLAEEYRPGRLGTGRMDVRLVVSGKRAEGMAKLFERVENVLNAIEVSHQTGQIDLGLGGTLARPFDLTTADAFATKISLNVQLILGCVLKPFERGRR